MPALLRCCVACLHNLHTAHHIDVCTHVSINTLIPGTHVHMMDDLCLCTSNKYFNAPNIVSIDSVVVRSFYEETNRAVVSQ